MESPGTSQSTHDRRSGDRRTGPDRDGAGRRRRSEGRSHEERPGRGTGGRAHARRPRERRGLDEVPRKPSGSGSASACKNFQINESDLVLDGRAEAGFKASGIQFASQSAVYQTTRMGQQYWKRFVLSPRLLECMSGLVLLGAVNRAKETKSELPRLASARRIAFPAVGANTRALRMLLDVPTESGDVRVLADIVFIWRGRTQLLLITTAPYEIEAVITPAEGRLARILVSRMRA